VKTYGITTCVCGRTIRVAASGSQLPKDFLCQCGVLHWAYEPLVCTRIFDRARMELQGGDWTLSILLSAIAVEFEAKRLFEKWKPLDLGFYPASEADKAAWDREWRKSRAVAARLSKLSSMLVGQTFDSFVRCHGSLLHPIFLKYHGSATCCFRPSHFFVVELFDRRNRIAHSGYIDFQQPDAEMCLDLANALLQILAEMDVLRIRALEAKHRA